MDGRPSIFEQLTPADDALRDDLDWLDSLLGGTDARDMPGNGAAGHASATHDPDGAAATAEPYEAPYEAEPDTAAARDATAPPPYVQAAPAARGDATPPPADDMREPASADTLDLASVADPMEGADATARPRAKAVRIAAVAVAATMAALLCALAALHIASDGRRASADRVQSSMSRLETWTARSRALLDQADEAGLEGRGDVEKLRTRTERNKDITGRKRAGLSTNESDILADKADKAVERTRSLYSKVSELVKAKPSEDAKKTCSTALDKARKAAAGATASDDATRAALDTLNGLISKAEGFKADATARQWTDMASSLDQARDALSKALDAKTKADEAAKAQADAERQAQDETQQAEPQAGPTTGQQYTAPQYSGSGGATGGGTSPGTQSQGSTDTGSNGWYVPPATGDDSLPDNDSSL